MPRLKLGHRPHVKKNGVLMRQNFGLVPGHDIAIASRRMEFLGELLHLG